MTKALLNYVGGNFPYRLQMLPVGCAGLGPRGEERHHGRELNKGLFPVTIIILGKNYVIPLRFSLLISQGWISFS